jgi:hypothetical protein
MRTKSLLGLAALAASALAVQAATTPVYSLNIVGYVNASTRTDIVTGVPLGTSLLANPLDADGTNSASTVLNLAPLNDTLTSPPGTLNQITIHTWNGVSYNTYYYENDFTPNTGGSTAYTGWATDNNGTTAVDAPLLPPGKGFFILNTLQVGTNTWVGNVTPGPNATNSPTIGLGTSLIASSLPITSQLVSGGLGGAAINFPLAPLNDTAPAPAGTLNQITIHTWNGVSYNTAYYEADFTPNNGGSTAYTGWATDNNGTTAIPAPTIPLGQGFFILNTLQTAPWSQGLSNGF